MIVFARQRTGYSFSEPFSHYYVVWHFKREKISIQGVNLYLVFFFVVGFIDAEIAEAHQYKIMRVEVCKPP